MSIKAYISNLSPLWSLDRQEQMLRESALDWPKGAKVYRDELDARQRRAHVSASQVDRELLLRPTTRPSAGTLLIPSLAVWAWSAEDMLEALTHAAAITLTVRVLDADLTIEPSPQAEVLHRAAQAFAEARKRLGEFERGKRGGQASGDKRKAEAKDKAERIRERWALPTADYPTLDLLREADLSLNTAKAHLGSRPAVQKAYRAALKRKAARTAKERG